MTEEQQRQIKIITEYSMAFRGSVLNECILMEKAIDDFIAKDISLDEQIQVRVFQILLDRMTFEAKITAFTAILDDNQDKLGFKKTNTKGYPHKGLIKQLRMIKDERNYFAHYPAWLEVEALPFFPKVGLINFRDKTKIEWYDEQRTYQVIELIHKTRKEIYKMIIEKTST